MKKSQEPYYWPLSRIIEEYNLIQNSASKLSSNQRRAVVGIYKQKQDKGLLPGQMEVFNVQMQYAAAAAEGLVIKLCQTLKIPIDLSSFCLVIDHSTIGEFVNYLVSYKGDFAGWIKVFLEGETYNAKYYVEEQKEKEKPGRVATFGAGPSGKRIAKAIADKGNNSKREEEV
jgi:hypothetical protein